MAKSNIKKTAISIFTIVVLGLIGAVLFIVIGSNAGNQSAIEMGNWIEENYGMTVSIGAITIIGSIAGVILTVLNKSSKATSDIGSKLEVTNEKLESVTAELKEVKENLNNQPKMMSSMNDKLSSIESQNKLQTEINCYTARKTTTDPTVLGLIDTFSSGELMNKIKESVETKSVKPIINEAKSLLKEKKVATAIKKIILK